LVAQGPVPANIAITRNVSENNNNADGNPADFTIFAWSLDGTDAPAGTISGLTITGNTCRNTTNMCVFVDGVSNVSIDENPSDTWASKPNTTAWHALGPNAIGAYNVSSLRLVQNSYLTAAKDSAVLDTGTNNVVVRMARIVPQRHEYLAMPQPPRQHVVFHNGDPAGVAVLVAKPFEDPLRGMPLLLRSAFILGQDAVDDPGERVELRTRRRPAPPVPGRHRKRQHLRYRSRVDPETPSRLPPAHAFNLNRITNPSIELHALHPPAW
jgi:hypothetical protein